MPLKPHEGSQRNRKEWKGKTKKYYAGRQQQRQAKEQAWNQAAFLKEY